MIYTVDHCSTLSASAFLYHLTDFDNFCIKLTGNDLCSSQYQNVPLHRARASTLLCKIENNAFYTTTKILHKALESGPDLAGGRPGAKLAWGSLGGRL